MTFNRTHPSVLRQNETKSILSLAKCKFNISIKSSKQGVLIMKPHIGCKYSNYERVFLRFQRIKMPVGSNIVEIFLYIYKLRLFKLNQMLKNIELPDRLKRAASSSAESCLISLGVQPALYVRFFRFQAKNVILFHKNHGFRERDFCTFLSF